MIPYFEIHILQLGPIPIQVWGLFVATGLVVATALGSRLFKQAGLDPRLAWDLSFVIMVGAIVGARLGHVFFYDWDFFRDHPLDIVMIWKGGLSSYGGFVGGALAGWLEIRRRKADLVRISDAALTALPLGWMIGRIGCFLIHDHPGTLTNSPFGVQFPDGARFDLGMIDGLIGLLIFALIYPYYRLIGRRIPGSTTAFVLEMYGGLRFFADFLRATDVPNADPRFYGLTPAQYASIAFVILGDVLLLRAVRRARLRRRAGDTGISTSNDTV